MIIPFSPAPRWFLQGWKASSNLCKALGVESRAGKGDNIFFLSLSNKIASLRC